MNVTEFRLKLYPKDYNLVRKFYQDTLGFSVLHEWDRKDSKGVMFQVGTTVLELLYPSENSGAVSGADVSWEVEDVLRLWDQLKLSQNIAHELRDNAWGDTSFAVYDPEGFKISFFTKHNRATIE